MALSKQVIMQGFKQLFGIPYIYSTHRFSLCTPKTYVNKVKYRLPFQDEWTVINGGISKEISHSWSVPTQRYAYDFVVMDEMAKTYDGEQATVQSYYGYGKVILAPADGVVVEIGNQCFDNVPFVNGQMDFTTNDIRGNYIIIKHAEKEYSFIGHIQPQSINVIVGQKVSCQESIAKCGNTGNSSEPHIHFHLQDGQNFFTSAGLPIVFENISVVQQKNYQSYDKRPSCLSLENSTYIHRGQRVKNLK